MDIPDIQESPFAGRGSKTDSNWRERANCKGDTTLFFAKKAERPQARTRRETKAQRLCEACEVLAQCRDFARDHREYGFWAGESEEDRHLLGYTVSAPIGIRARRHQTAS